MPVDRMIVFFNFMWNSFWKKILLKELSESGCYARKLMQAFIVIVFSGSKRKLSALTSLNWDATVSLILFSPLDIIEL